MTEKEKIKIYYSKWGGRHVPVLRFLAWVESRDCSSQSIRLHCRPADFCEFKTSLVYKTSEFQDS